VATYEDARVSALSFQIERLSHYGRPFKGLLVGAVGMVLIKSDSKKGRAIACMYENTFFTRHEASFRKNPKSIFNISCTREDAEVIDYVYSIPHVTLRRQARWGLGIVTGNNKKFFETRFREGLMPVYKGSDITKSGLLPPSIYIPKDMSLYQQVAPIDLYEASEKLIYKFISSNLCFFHDKCSRFVVNSANILITEEQFPVSMELLCSFFNSEFVNWMFGKIFNTHKILRGDLELLPIHHQLLMGKSFDEAEYLASINIERISGGAFRIKK
jgi:site-specific DNA-methyltransferase (adenine-specific)